MTALPRLSMLVLLLLVLPGFGSGERLFAPSSEPWPRWERHDPASATTVDHKEWSAFLARHMRPGRNGDAARLDYGAVSATDRAALSRYVAMLAEVPVSTLNRDEQMAYWINLYNTLTMQVVLDAYPVTSIRDIDISPGLFASGPWGKALVTVEGEGLSLNDIEHRILRPVWRDPRIHYAVNCASIGCPDLRVTAWASASLDADLDAAARAYVNSPRGVRVSDGEITVSKIYDWFIEDFGGDEAGVLAHLTRYATGPTADALTRIGDLSGTDYDWSLNDAR